LKSADAVVISGGVNGVSVASARSIALSQMRYASLSSVAQGGGVESPYPCAIRPDHRGPRRGRRAE